MDPSKKARLVSFIETELVRGRPGFDLNRDSLVDSGVIDSLGIMKLVGFLEQELKVRVSDDDLLPENFDTLSAIEQLVDRRA